MEEWRSGITINNSNNNRVGSIVVIQGVCMHRLEGVLHAQSSISIKFGNVAN